MVYRGRRLATTSAAVVLSMGLIMSGVLASTAGASSAKVPGVTATQVTIGTTQPLTGIASAGYNEIGPAMSATFAWIDSHGGVNGRKIKLIVKDDCYNVLGIAGCASSLGTVAQTHALLSVPVFATVGALGTPTQDLVRGLLNSSGVPQLMVSSGSTDWNNPNTYSGLFGWQPSYTEEGKIFAQYILATFPKANVCFLGQGDDFGTDGLKGLLDEGLTPSQTSFYSTDALAETNGANIEPVIAQFQSEKCTLVVLDTIPGATDAALGYSGALGFSPQWVISSVGSDPVTVDAPLAKEFPTDPEIGAVTFSYLPTPGSSSPWNAWMTQVMTADYPGYTAGAPINGNERYGIALAVTFAEALKDAGRNFTRASFLKTLTSATLNTPALVPVRYTKSSHQGINGGYLTTVTSSTDESPITGTVVTTDSTLLGPISSTQNLSSSVPGWLK